MTTERVWANPHDDAPTDDDGRPIHPEKGYPVCAYEKTDAVDHTKDGKREDIAYCLRRAGWGTDRDTGHCRTHGGKGGAPTGWRNGNARHLLYSKRMNEDDREKFEALVETDDGELITVDELRRTLANMISFEEMRLSRAIDKVPGAEQITMHKCPECGKKHREPSGDCDGDVRVAPQVIEPCGYYGDFKPIPGKSWVDFGDKAVERKEAHIANLIQTLNRIDGGETMNVNADVDQTINGDGDPIEVNITSVGVDLPDGEDEEDDTDGEE